MNPVVNPIVRKALELEVPRAYAHLLASGSLDKATSDGFFALARWLYDPPSEDTSFVSVRDKLAALPRPRRRDAIVRWLRAFPLATSSPRRAPFPG